MQGITAGAGRSPTVAVRSGGMRSGRVALVTRREARGLTRASAAQLARARAAGAGRFGVSANAQRASRGAAGLVRSGRATSLRSPGRQAGQNRVVRTPQGRRRAAQSRVTRKGPGALRRR